MELNLFFIFLVVCWTIGPLLFGSYMYGLNPYLKRLSFKVLINLVVLGLSLFLATNLAGYISFGCWLWLILLPALGLRLITRYLLQQRYASAYHLATILARLDPMGNVRFQLPLIRAMELGQSGELAAAFDLLTHTEQQASDLSITSLTRCYLYRLTNDWEGLISWLETSREVNHHLLNDVNTSIFYLRALGETGRLEGMFEFFKQKRSLFLRTRQLRAACLFLVAFAGERAALQGLLSTGSFKQYSPPLKQFWLATAALAGGELESGMAVLNELALGQDKIIGGAARYRLEHPIILTRYQLGKEHLTLLARLVRELPQAQRYSIIVLRSTRPRPYLTWLIVVVNVVMFWLVSDGGGGQNFETMYRLGVLLAPESAQTGEWWRLVTSVFLHFYPWHLISNMITLLLIGPFVEYSLGRWRFISTYFVTGIASGIVILLLTQFEILPAAQVAGASGAITGLAGAAGAILLRVWWQEGARIARNQLVFLVGLIIFSTATNLPVLPVGSTVIHLSGLIFGLLLASRLRYPGLTFSTQSSAGLAAQEAVEQTPYNRS